MSAYIAALKDAMSLCAAQPNPVFMGQSVACDGTGMSQTFRHLDPATLLELPVFENTQLSMATGMALAGCLPVCVFPRMNFLLCATDALVNHLDKLPLYSDYRPRVIIRVAVPTATPMDPGPQHLGDFRGALKIMLKTVRIERLPTAGDIVPAYRRALAHNGSTVLVEYSGAY